MLLTESFISDITLKGKPGATWSWSYGIWIYN